MTDAPPSQINSPGRARRRLVPLVAVAIAIVTVVAVGAAIVAPALGVPTPLVERVDPKLPDLSIAPYSEVAGARDAATKEERLRFGVMLTNVGAGDLRLRATRPNLFSEEWTVRQEVVEGGGGFTAVATPATLIFAGDGHDHWHVREVEAHRLETLDGEILGEVVKQGFCFFDTDAVVPAPADAPADATYHSGGCGGPYDVSIAMGLSIGWGDEYPWHMFEQQIVVSDVPDGQYRLRAIADPSDIIEELDETNNEYWEVIELTRDIEGIPDIVVVGTSRD